MQQQYGRQDCYDEHFELAFRKDESEAQKFGMRPSTSVATFAHVQKHEYTPGEELKKSDVVLKYDFVPDASIAASGASHVSSTVQV